MRVETHSTYTGGLALLRRWMWCKTPINPEFCGAHISTRRILRRRGPAVQRARNARAVPASWFTPVLDDLHDRLGPNFDPLLACRGRHQLLASASHTTWRQKRWSDAIGKADALRLLDAVEPQDQGRILEYSVGIGSGGWMTV